MEHPNTFNARYIIGDSQIENKVYFLLDKKPIVCDMRWVDWKFIKENEEHFPGVYDSFKACGVDTFVARKLTKWNDELIMQFYSTAHFYPDGRIAWMSEGTR